jgi:hypothetical protein
MLPDTELYIRNLGKQGDEFSLEHFAFISISGRLFLSWLGYEILF